MEFDTLESTKERLENWKIAYRNHPTKRVTKSLEGRYRSPQHWDVKEVHAVINLLDAHKVESAWVVMPTPHKEILKYNCFNAYIPPRVFCKSISISTKDLEIEIGRAIRMIDNLLR